MKVHRPCSGVHTVEFKRIRSEDKHKKVSSLFYLLLFWGVLGGKPTLETVYWMFWIFVFVFWNNRTSFWILENHCDIEKMSVRPEIGAGLQSWLYWAIRVNWYPLWAAASCPMRKMQRHTAHQPGARTHVKALWRHEELTGAWILREQYYLQGKGLIWERDREKQRDRHTERKQCR